MPREHVVTSCENCVVENQGTCLLSSNSLPAFTRDRRNDAKASPDWCPLRAGPVLLRIEPDEATEGTE